MTADTGSRVGELKGSLPERTTGPAATPKSAAPDPFYVRQTAEVMTDDQAREWYENAAREAHAAGAVFARYSYHPDNHNLRLVEAWRERPADQGELRWALTDAREHSSPLLNVAADPGGTAK